MEKKLCHVCRGSRRLFNSHGRDKRCPNCLAVTEPRQ
jgi:hypothetical protein